MPRVFRWLRGLLRPRPPATPLRQEDLRVLVEAALEWRDTLDKRRRGVLRGAVMVPGNSYDRHVLEIARLDRAILAAFLHLGEDTLGDPPLPLDGSTGVILTRRQSRNTLR